MKLSRKVAIVTGGGSGIGEAICRAYAKEGAIVAVADLNQEAGEALASELGNVARFCRTDICSEAEVQAAVDTAVREFGGLYGAVNCAGIAIGEKVVGREGPHRLDSFAKCIQINLIGNFNVLRLAAHAMSQNTPDDNGERGIVINTASVAAFDGQIGQCAYSASKGGLVAMTLPAARELARSGIRVNTIAPGIFATPMMAGMPQEVQDSLGKTVPFPARLGKPEEYAQLAQSIIENPMLNGETIRLDGALRMAPK